MQAGAISVVVLGGAILMAAAAKAAPPAPAPTKIVLPAIFGAHMVWPAGRVVPLAGRTRAGDLVAVTAPGHTAEVRADGDGHFRIELPALAAGSAPFEIEVTSTGAGGVWKTVLTDVVLGDVWLASGQSNMEWPLYASDGGAGEIATPTTQPLRLFQVARPAPESLAPAPVPVRGRWARVSPESVARFSAVAYHFGRTLTDARRGRPIGLVASAWGGSRIEPWIRRAALAGHPEIGPKIAAAARTPAPSPEALATYRQALAAFEAQNGDPGDRGSGLGFARPGPPPPGWRLAELPARAEIAAGRVIWLRREVALPSAFVGQPLIFATSGIDRCDTTFVEGTLVGATCERTMLPARFPRAYRIPAPLSRSRITIAIRVFEPAGHPTWVEPAVLRPAGGGAELTLAGRWWWRAEPDDEAPVATTRPAPPAGLPHYQNPGVLWDNMAEGLGRFPFAGVIWYQGESNTREAYAYRDLLHLLIRDWRRAFATPKLPFLIAQLAAYHPPLPGAGQRTDEEWAELREAQAKVAATDPAAGLAVTIDIGTREDIHPGNKREVGRRLGLVALARVYGEKVPFSGPTYAGHEALPGGAVRVRFEHGAGLATGPGPARLLGFEIAGSDRVFVTADARIEGETVVLSAPGVTRPAAIRYGWGDAPVCNLINWAGLPAPPFRSDGWPRFSARGKRPRLHP